MKPALRSVTAMIPTGGGLDEALDFYVRHLGFSVVWRAGSMAGIRRDDVAFNLVENDNRDRHDHP
jgi:catechol 2,3-dioxygenase-like lactoylglutathione lyase family enzyme